MNHAEKTTCIADESSAVGMGVRAAEMVDAEGFYTVACTGPREEFRDEYCSLRDKVIDLQTRKISAWARFKMLFKASTVSREIDIMQRMMASMVEPKWIDEIHNVVCTEGKNAALQAIFKASAFTSTVYMGLIGNVTYTAPVAGNTASAIATSASANGWNEAAAATSAARAAPSFAAPSAGAVSLSAARTFSMLATDTINGCFVLITSVALVAPAATVANTAGSLWSAGPFTGGAKSVANGDTLNVSYTASM